MSSHSKSINVLYNSSALLAVNSFIENNTWLAQRRFKFNLIQSANVPFNSTPVLKVRTDVKPSSKTSCCRKGDKRLLQVTIILLVVLKSCIIAAKVGNRNGLMVSGFITLCYALMKAK